MQVGGAKCWRFGEFSEVLGSFVAVMALRNHLLLGNRAGAAAFGGDCAAFLPGKPLGTRAQRLAVRRSVLLWGARANLDSATDLFTDAATGRAGGGSVKLENRLEKVGFDVGLSLWWGLYICS